MGVVLASRARLLLGATVLAAGCAGLTPCAWVHPGESTNAARAPAERGSLGALDGSAPPSPKALASGLPNGGAADAGAQSVATRQDAAPDTPAARYPFQAPLPSGDQVATSPATRTANLAPAQCMKALRERALPAKRARRAAPGVATPLNLTGPLQGVRVRTAPPRSPYGILDCRLVLALDDFARIVARHDVVEIRIDNMYRPHARLPGRRKLSQHARGLAADIPSLVLGDGRTLEVKRDWHGTLGMPACGPDASPVDPTQETILLRNLLCETSRAGLFHHMLTGNDDAAHETHFHFDIQRRARRTGVR